MAAGKNLVVLIGNLGAEPEVRYTPAGKPVCELRLATNESWTDSNGQKQERTEWHRVVVWGKRAEACGKYLNKGRQVYVEGKLRTRSWQDDKFTDAKGTALTRYAVEIVANDVQFLGKSENSQNRPPEPPIAEDIDEDFNF